jgi:branched-chain amino acid transport system permease protein
MHAALAYTGTSLVYLCVDVLACWALNLQFGLTGVYNLGLIVFQSAGAYAAAVVSLGPDTGNGHFQTYVLGMSLPYPLPLVVGGVVGGLLAFVIGAVVLRRIRADYQAMVLLVFAVMANLLVSDMQGFLNGPSGLSLVPQPFASVLKLSPLGYEFAYVVLCVIVCAIAYLFVRRISSSPLGRSLRMVREDERAAEALGKNPYALRLFSFVAGGVLAGVSGALLVGYLTVWAPSAWGYAETLVILTAIIVGGAGNDWGVVLGALIVPVLISQGSSFLPSFGPPQLVPALQWVLIGVLGLAFVYFWPRGIIPERKASFKQVSDDGLVRRRLVGGSR